MKALSIRQPWAWLIVNGYKDVENRSWYTAHRGPFLIHAGKRFDDEGYKRVKARMAVVMPEPQAFERGGIVGRADLVDCVTRYDSPWFSGKYGFVLRDARPLPFAPMPGKLQFFDVDEPAP